MAPCWEKNILLDVYLFYRKNNTFFRFVIPENKILTGKNSFLSDVSIVTIVQTLNFHCSKLKKNILVLQIFFIFTWSAKSNFIIIPQLWRKEVFRIFKLSTWLDYCPTIICAESLNRLILDVNCFDSSQCWATWKVSQVLTTIS